MMIGPISAWLGGVFGPRRVLTISVVVFGISNSLLPLSPNLGYVFAFQAISGLASGTFIPLAIGFVVQNLPAQMVIYGVILILCVQFLPGGLISLVDVVRRAAPWRSHGPS